MELTRGKVTNIFNDFIMAIQCCANILLDHITEIKFQGNT